VRDAIARAGAELVLHGHNHRAEFYAVDGPRGPVPVIGVPSASTAAHAPRPGKADHSARWHLIEIARTQSGWRSEVVARRLTLNGAFEECGRFAFDSPDAQAGFSIAS
jgi:hypothetical protein